MYCVNCGAKLSAGQKVCPICETEVYHPSFASEPEIRTYPDGSFKSEEFNYKGLLFVITILYLIPLILPMILEISWVKNVGWSGYVTGGCILFYLAFILPYWWKRPNPVIITPCFLAAAILFLWYVCWNTGGSWFFPCALPISAALFAIITAMTAVLKYVRRGRLFTVGGGIIALGVWTVELEILIRVTFGVDPHFYWSISSFGFCFIVGILLIIIGIVKPFRDSLKKIFYIGKV